MKNEENIEIICSTPGQLHPQTLDYHLRHHETGTDPPRPTLGKEILICPQNMTREILMDRKPAWGDRIP